MNLVPLLNQIEKLITEKGSAAVLQQHIDFFKTQLQSLEGEVSKLEKDVAKLELKLEGEQALRKVAECDLQGFKNEHAEEVRLVENVEFRRGKRTGMRWDAFCPKCHMPLQTTKDQRFAYCVGGCGLLSVELNRPLNQTAKLIEQGHL